MPILRIVLIDVSLSLVIAVMGALLVALSLSAVERWRTAVLAWRRGRHSQPKMTAADAPYAVEVNVRMIAEVVSSTLRRGYSISPIYAPSGLVRAPINHKKRFGGGPGRIHARSIRRFGTEPGNEKVGMRGHRLRNSLHEYAGQE